MPIFIQLNSTYLLIFKSYFVKLQVELYNYILKTLYHFYIFNIHYKILYNPYEMLYTCQFFCLK